VAPQLLLCQLYLSGHCRAGKLPVAVTVMVINNRHNANTIVDILHDRLIQLYQDNQRVIQKCAKKRWGKKPRTCKDRRGWEGVQSKHAFQDGCLIVRRKSWKEDVILRTTGSATQPTRGSKGFD
jgi:hypothetical protein